jgi:hypothetical protein
MENLFDPQTIMLGGNAPDWLIDALVEGVQPLYPSVGRRGENSERYFLRFFRIDLPRCLKNHKILILAVSLIPA